MGQTCQAWRIYSGFILFILSICPAFSAFALSNGCLAVNSLSGSTSLDFATNSYPSSAFQAGDTLTVSFTDSGSAVGQSPTTADSIGFATYAQSRFQTYNAANATSSTPHPVTLSLTTGDLATNGLRVRATTSFGQIRGLMFSCTGVSADSDDATLSGLTLSAGTLSPSFSAGNTSYRAPVVNSVASVYVTPVVNESHATVKVNGSAVSSGSASQDINLVAGSDTNIPIIVTAQDGTTKTYTVTVTRAEASPVATASNFTVLANSSNNTVPLVLSGGAATSVSMVTSPLHGSAVISGTTINYSPAAGFSGSDSFTYIASNSGGTSAPATVTIHVSPPTLLFTPSAGGLNTATAGSVWSQSLTVSGGTAPYTWSASSLPQGLSLNATTGVLNGTPATAGNYLFQVNATDAYGAAGSVSYSLAVNDAVPVAGNVSVVVSANSSIPVPLNISGGAAAGVTIASPPSHGSAVANGTLITYIPTPGYSGTDSFTYTASNSAGTSAPGTVTITVSAPVLTMTPAQGTLPAAIAGHAWTQSFSVSGGTAPYTWSASSLPAGLTLNATTGVLNGTPAAAGNYMFQITASDRYGVTSTVNYSLTVGDAAPLAGNVSVTVNPDASNPIPLMLSGGPATAVNIASPPSHGSAIANGTVITYTPAPGYSGADSFTYTASNSGGTSAPATVTLTVSAPQLAITPAAGVLPKATSGVHWSQNLTVSGGASPYVWRASGLPAGLSLNGTTGVLSGTPDTAGNFVFQIAVTDAHGATGTVSYSLDVGDALPNAGNVSITVNANSSTPVPLILSGGIASTVNVVSPPAHGSAVVHGTSITYTPAPGYSGTDRFTYTASNSSGTSAPATVDINVSSPAMTVSPATGALPAAITGAAWSQRLTVSGGASPYTWKASALPAGISLDANTGLISGTPLTSGHYAFQVTATGSNGVTSTVNYSLLINASIPAAQDVATTVTAGAKGYVIPLAIKGAVTSVAIVAPPAHGNAVVSGLRILYTPFSGYSGQDSFTYNVTSESGTSLPATVSLSVTSNDIALLPASGQLPPGVAGQTYVQAFTASGGILPYSWQLSGTLPKGLSFSDGQINGVPDAAGSASFTVTATDAAGNTKHTSYTLLIDNTAPAGADYSASVDAGKTVTINLTEKATGGPFTGASLLNQPEKEQGTASLHTSGGNYQMTFTADPKASGTVILRYVLKSAYGTSQPANITLTIAGRPDPSKDADVTGMVSAQNQASQNFARAQIRNFSDRLEKIHTDASLPSDLSGIRFMMPYSRPERTAESRMQITEPQKKIPDRSEGTPLVPAPSLSNNNEATRLSYWTGGYVDFGNNKADGVQLSHTTVGITTGVDYRFAKSFTGGMGIGFGRDVSDIGDDGSRNNGQAFSTALYGSFHPDAWFIDGLMGFSRLSFDSKRAVSGSSARAQGSRSGHQAFGALISGYEFLTLDSLISPYTRLQYYRTWLDGYAETGAGDYGLAFAPQSLSQFETSVGLRGEHRISFNWGVANFQGRLEYSQMLNKNNSARVGYADVSDDTWRLPLYEQGRETIALGTGVDFLLSDNVMPGIAYQGTLGLDESRTRDQMVMVRINIGF
ncbi:Ig-like domain-containing protein [Enterobacter sp. R1(2018)]|uniref:Ig-like domain-containing protein n=1 Tax=Enterobacter sp. R1(2018) TaxID=2447891 RepID=UPI000EB5B195|nr:putative Ig domain-containing protein [Enterobacter sp. R1(2018)]RKQ41422.1 tandem-95 repeat protein [Enterobacter sp. R1(2018)]